jgi:putative transcriptional regulator
LIGEHNDEGALGVVLNRPLDISAEESLPDVLSQLVPPDEPLFQGGPVQPNSPVLLVELSEPDVADLLVFGAVGFLIGDVPAEVETKIIRARIFAGYAGWGPGQLESEMAEDSWIVEAAQAEDVFAKVPELLWSRVLERKGPEFRRLSRMPFDPSMN